MQANQLLKEASERIFSLGTGDASEVVSRLNMRYGLGKIIYALQKRGLDYNQTLCVFTPDGGITRNKERWQYGFGYGCLIRWPNADEIGQTLVFPQIKPNACGMIVAKINDIYNPKDLCDKLHKIEESGLFDKSKDNLNVGVSNHFIEVCKVSESNSSRLKEGDVAAIIHTSPSEKKSLLYNFEGWYEKGGEWDNSPLGSLLVLEGKVAKDYLQVYKRVEQYSLEKRLAIAQKLFGDFELISNPTHQGITADNEVRLGSYEVKDKEELLPVAFRWNLDIHLISPENNLKAEIIEKLPYKDQLKKLGLVDAFQSVNILPHGGGYQIPFSSSGWAVIENGSKRLFSNKNNGTNFVFSSPSEVPYYYRGLKILSKIEQLRLGKTAVKLKQEYTLKY